MFCVKCGKKIAESAAFCGYCGHRTKSATQTVQNEKEQIEKQTVAEQTIAEQTPAEQTPAEQTIAEQAAEAVPKKSKGKAIIWIALLVVIVGLGSTAGYFVSQKGWQVADWFKSSEPQQLADHKSPQTDRESDRDERDSRRAASDEGEQDPEKQDSEQQDASRDDAEQAIAWEELEIIIEVNDVVGHYVAKSPHDGDDINQTHIIDMIQAFEDRMDLIHIEGHVTQVDGVDKIRVTVPTVEDVDQAFRVLTKPFRLTLRDVDGTIKLDDHDFKFGTGEVAFDGLDLPIVTIETESKLKLEEVTGELVGQQVGIYLDDLLLSSPTVATAITNGAITISGLSFDEAQEIAKVFNLQRFPLSLVGDGELERNLIHAVTVDFLPGVWDVTDPEIYMYYLNHIAQSELEWYEYNEYFFYRMEFIRDADSLTTGTVKIYGMDSEGFSETSDSEMPGYVYHFDPITQLLLFAANESDAIEPLYLQYVSEDSFYAYIGEPIEYYIERLEMFDSDKYEGVLDVYLFAEDYWQLAEGLEAFLDDGEFFYQGFIFDPEPALFVQGR